MAVQTYYVDPTAGSNGSGTFGSPFNSLNNARLALTTAFNASSDDYNIICLPGTDASSFTWILAAGGTPRKLIIEASSPHNGTRGTGYRLTGAIFSFNNTNTDIALEVAGLAALGIVLDGSQSDGLIDDCLFAEGGNTIYVGAGIATIRNTACLSAGTNGILVENNNGNPTVNMYNCTILGAAAHAARRNTGTLILKNTYADGATDAYSGTMTRSNCMHSSASVFTGSTASVAKSTANFVSVTDGSEDPHLVSGSALIGAGVGPSSDASIPTVDFEGTVRSGATTDVGFDQRTAPAGGNVARAAHFYRQQRAVQ